MFSFSAVLENKAGDYGVVLHAGKNKRHLSIFIP